MASEEVVSTKAAAKRPVHGKRYSRIGTSDVELEDGGEPVGRPSKVVQRLAGGGVLITFSRLESSQQRTELLITAVGSAAKLADILGVSRSQPTRWRKGDESPSPQKARELVDLDHVMARALMLFPQPVALDWLNSANAYLDGARPIDVLQLRGSTEVIDALDAAMSGAFA